MIHCECALKIITSVFGPFSTEPFRNTFRRQMRDTPAETKTFDVEIETIKCEHTIASPSHTNSNEYVRFN